MKTLSRITIVSLAFVLLGTFLHGTKASASAAEDYDLYFPADIGEHWAFFELDNFMNADFLKGYRDNNGVVTVKPDQAINRAEFVALLVRVLGLTGNGAGAGNTFEDVDHSKWYADPISIASAHGIVNGISASEFAPERLVNRGEIATMIVRAFDQSLPYGSEANSFEDVPEYFAKEYIVKASEAGIITGVTDKLFMPFAPAKRAEAVVMLDRALYATPGGNNDLAELFEVLQSAEQKQNEALINKSYSDLNEISDFYFTGYYLALSRYETETLLDLIQDGVVVDMKLISPQSYSVYDYSDRVAIVEATGGKYELTTNFEGESETETITSDGVYYLKRMMDNSWKIYAYYEVE
ncbi:S-layer homology domain-containing protein [Paenibacillus sp. strain BS8-2]